MAMKLVITQIRSPIGRNRSQKEVLRGLGLRRMHHTVVRENTPQIRGMVKKICHLLKWEEVDDSLLEE